MKFDRGDVILVNYPFASGTGSKVRPAVIVRKIGTLPDNLMPQVAACLKASLDLP
jgi:mRNA-degrading endonuclease toxin of MazEF toxin-antitoxin module